MTDERKEKRMEHIGERIEGYENKSDEWKEGMLAGWDACSDDLLRILFLCFEDIRKGAQEAYFDGLNFGAYMASKGYDIEDFKMAFTDDKIKERMERKKKFSVVKNMEDE